MKVKIINKGRDGESLCFKVVDENGIVYLISDCIVKETLGTFDGYFGSYEGHPAHLNIIAKDNVVLLLNNENLSEM